MHILCLGDSITDCDRLFSSSELGTGYVNFLSEKAQLFFSDIHITNRGVDGFTITRLKERLNGWLLDFPDLVTILIGINDLSIMMTTNRTPEQQTVLLSQFFSHYEKIITDLKAQNCSILLIEPFLFPWPSEYRTWFPLLHVMSQGIWELANKYSLPFLSLQKLLNEEASRYGYDFITTDGIHLTSQGHHILADALLNEILTSAKLCKLCE